MNQTYGSQSSIISRGQEGSSFSLRGVGRNPDERSEPSHLSAAQSVADSISQQLGRSADIL
ncbi:hypothetical protein BV98_002253 [Sphingobium herbicidovorans NBRC 16415]|uniref:Uncharacterized protein n=1 Tax=Sphingobium herbicidovorans (strain ATCC 700291 / DSM 11019 / CCUG 56400 / KCTC 2939 / LMG 18315 / NBRC 16415 / MH) TaxID=1219045 RepID=A0A086P989_SPHHM|nr:hypothetical protein BV98_002253 [Sphingobium herbicidovorans NBRC 16415]